MRNYNRLNNVVKVLEYNSDKSKESFEQIINFNELFTHSYMLASSGSGKTELIKILFRAIFSQNNSNIILFDPHGDLAKQCFHMLKRTEHIIYIDLNIDDNLTPTINPMRMKNISENSIEVLAQELIYAFENILETEFSNNMEALLTPLIYTLLRKGDSGIDELVRFLDDENNEDLYELSLQSPIKGHVEFMKTQFKKQKFAPTKDALATKLQIFLNNPKFSNFITGDNTIDLEKAINNNKTVIFRFPKGELRKTFNPITKLVMALIQSIIFKRSRLAETNRPRTYLFCDEYQNFKGQITNEFLNESRKNNLCLFGAHQHLSQLDKENKDAMLSASNIIIVGKNSQSDLLTMSKELDVDIESLKQLNKGEFFIKIGTKKAFKIQTNIDYMKNLYASDSFTIIDNNFRYQKEKYYKKIDTSNTINMENNINQSKVLIPKFNLDEE